MVIMVVLGLTVSAGAQTKVRGNMPVRSRIIIAAPVYPSMGMGFGFGFGNRWGSPFYDPFQPFNDPFYRNRMGARQVMPSELQLQMDEINNEYKYRIATTREDKSISGKERRQKIRELKYEQESAILDVRRDFQKENLKRRNQ